jgi:hypothetical protein
MMREDCRFHCKVESELTLTEVADTTQELFHLFSTVRNESDIEILQKGTILDDSLQEVQTFLESRVMNMQLYMYYLEASDSLS